MTTPQTLEANLLVLFGELRGDVKSLLKSNGELKDGMLAMETRLEEQVKAVEAEMLSKHKALSERVSALEAIRLKVAGFALALTILGALFSHKLGPFAQVLSKLFGV